MTIHTTVLLKETVDALNLKPGMTVVDATLGGGGHALEVLKKIGAEGTLIAFDQDADAIARFEQTLRRQKIALSPEHIILVHDNFANLKDRLSSLRIDSVDAICADLGISSDQLDDAQRGMTFQEDGPLDMRMDRSHGLTAADVVNTYEERELARILTEYADEKFSRKIAHAIIEARTIVPITRSVQLVDIVADAVPEKFKHQKINFATRTFQALRIEVNKELEILGPFLAQAVDVLKPTGPASTRGESTRGGRLAVITFHSGEDAIVKHTLRDNARGCICPPEFPVCRCSQKAKIKTITRKPIGASEEEVRENPRSRSAKLRVVEKLPVD